MNAGLLADIILGESPHLKGLARHFNMVVLDSSGRITGFNNHFLKNIKKREDQIINQTFAKYFDCDEGKADLMMSIKCACKGQPTSIQFSVLENKVTFKGVILPVYDNGQNPSSLIIIAKEEHYISIDEDEIEDFWSMASKMMEEAGIASSTPEITNRLKMQKPRILFVEDQNGLIVKIFKKVLSNKNKEFLIAPSSEAAILMASEFKPNVVISHHNPIGNLALDNMASTFKKEFNANTIFLSSSGNELRIEDGWLDIHVKNHPDSVPKILELINQLYW